MLQQTQSNIHHDANRPPAKRRLIMVIWLIASALEIIAGDILVDTPPTNLSDGTPLYRSICQSVDTGQETVVFNAYAIMQPLIERYNRHGANLNDLNILFGLNESNQCYTPDLRKHYLRTSTPADTPFTYCKALLTDIPDSPVDFSFPWKNPMVEINSEPLVFHNLDGSLTKVKYIAGTYDFGTAYVDNDTLQAIRIELDDFGCNLEIIIPKAEGAKPSDYIPQRGRNIFYRNEQLPVHIELPSITLDFNSDTDIAETLKQIGITSPSLTGEPIKQRGRITFGKSGINNPTEAPKPAFGRLPSRNFIVNRPFYFILRYCGMPLTFGIVNSLANN